MPEPIGPDELLEIDAGYKQGGKLVRRQGILVHVKNRPCLSCNRRFFSEGPQHRICDKCKATVFHEASLFEHSFASRS